MMKRGIASKGRMSSKEMKISVIIPTLNEGDCIGQLLEELPQDAVDEVIIVDGNSIDNTREVVQSFGYNAYLQKSRGYGGALREGCEIATGDIIIMMDADGSHNPADITKIVEMMKEGYEYVMASRYLQGGKTEDDTWIRFTGNMLFTWLTNIVHGMRVTDSLYLFTGITKDGLKRLDLRCDGFEFCPEILIKAHKAGLRFAEVSAMERKRFGGKSKVNAFFHGLKILKEILRLRFQPDIYKKPRNQDFKKIFDGIAENYDAVSNVYSRRRRGEALVKWAKGDILEVGAGSGAVAMMLPNRSRLVVSDISEEMCRVAEKKLGVKAVCCDAQDLPFKNNSFDTVIASEVIYCLDSPEKFVSEAYRVLRPQGTLLISCANHNVARFYDGLRRLMRKMGISRMYFDDRNRKFSELGQLTSMLQQHNFEVREGKRIMVLPAPIGKWLDNVFEKSPLNHLGLFIIVRATKNVR